MSDYEFWDELGNIFNAVVAYQRKTIEFNKRFVNPWIRMGTVFDKEDRNAEAVSAYRKALEIDPDNASSWQGLGDVYFKMGSFEDAATAYKKAAELDPTSGWSYANLALTEATRQNYTEAINLYIKSLELISEDKDRSMIWNRLGNVYRKVGDYENAFIAFQMADECDAANTGFSDPLDEVTPDQLLVPVEEQVSVSEVTGPVAEETVVALAPNAEMTDAAVEETLAAELMKAVDESVAEAAAAEETVALPVVESPVIEEQPSEIGDPVVDESANVEAVVEEEVAVVEDTSAVAEEVPGAEVVTESVEVSVPAADTTIKSVATDQPEPVAEVAAVEEMPVVAEETPVEIATETVTAVMSHAVETFADPNEFAKPTLVILEDTQPEPALVDVGAELQSMNLGDVVVVAIESLLEELIADRPDGEAEAVAETQPEIVAEATEPAPVESTEAVAVEAIPQVEEAALINESDAQSNESIIEEIVTLAGKNNEVAYEEFLKDTVEPQIAVVEETTPAQAETVEPVKAEIKIEPDTKNAHVWNELGNVYFNAGAYEDAIAAYNKAIELDGGFAWPYSNLALAYVQKEKYTDAVLLYQRSIELFSNDKDKAVTWNRLGSVYRRLSDYENAIASYQRADDLDPNNATRSLKSRFSLLGSYSAEQTSTFVS